MRRIVWMVWVALLGLLVAGCVVPPQPPFTGGGAGTPTPAAAQGVKQTRSDTLFALRVGETAHVADAGLEITFTGVTADERCPLNLACEIDGPVHIALQVRDAGQGAAQPLDLAVHTNDFGLTDISAPDSMPAVEYGAWSIGVVSVTPYPDAQRPDRPRHDQVALVVLPVSAGAAAAGQSTQGQPPPP